MNNIPELPSINKGIIKLMPKFPGYAITNTGDVWSCRRNGKGKSPFGSRWYILKPGITRNGLLQVVLYNPNTKRKYQIKVHELVLEHFVGPRPPSAICCHWDGNPSNNHIDNLRWGTPFDNAEDRRRHKRFWGEAVHTSKLTADKVAEIRKLHDGGISQCELGRRFGVSQANIWAIVHNKTWIQI